MNTLEKYQELTQKAEKYQQKIDQGKGALDVQLKQLKDEFDCDNLEAAQKLLEKQKKKAEKAEKEFKESVEAFEEEWDEALRNV